MMKNPILRFLSAVLAGAVLLVLSVCPVSAVSHADDLSLACRVDYLVRLNDGAVLLDNNAAESVAPASVTKITTALVVLRSCSDLQKKVVVNGDTLDSLQNTNSSLSAIADGEEITVENLLRCMMIPSGNDAALVLAEYVGGSQEKFVQMMNDCAEELGCTGTHYDNPHGLDSETHYSTARDIVLITRAAMEYDIFREIISTHEYTLPATNKQEERTLTSTNDLMNPESWLYRDFVHGVKTGHTDAAGYCLVSYAEQNGTEYISVAMGGDYYDYNEAFYDSVNMLDWAYAHFQYMTVCTEGQTAFSLPVLYADDTGSVAVGFAETVSMYLYDGDVQAGVTVVPVDVPQNLTAPLREGKSVGHVEIVCGGETVATVEVCVLQDVHFDCITYIKETGKTPVFVAVVCLLAGVVLFVVMSVLKKKSART